jgi:PAS domain S-box-containing protein
MPSYLAKLALLAGIYLLAGKLGLSLAVPPGYATVIWPPSGIVVGILLLHGRALAPGVFIGSFLLNAMVGHAPHDLPNLRELALAVCIAAGSTLQALLSHALIVRWFGQPVRLRNFPDLIKLLLVTVPTACLVAPTVAVLALYLLADLPVGAIFDNWFTWWTGDMFGVMVFLPLTLVISRRTALLWRERPVRGLNALSLTLLVLPLGLTFIAWKTLADTTYRQSQARFATLAHESEQAMTARLAGYASAARSGAGIFQSSEFVSREEWRSFVDALRLQEDHPGTFGLGWIENGVITYLEPGPVDGAAVGLDLSRQPAMREAARLAAESGFAVLTQALLLGTDEDLAPGFLLMQPVYYADRSLQDARQRHEALRGFVFVPFQARGLFAGLTPSQGLRMDVTLHEVGEAVAARREGPLFTTRVGNSSPLFVLRSEVRVFGTPWAMEWHSTVEFERAESSGGAIFVLLGGLLFTGLFAVLLMVFGSRRTVGHGTGPLERSWLLPLATFALVGGGSFAAYALLSDAEKSHIESQLEGETRRLEAEFDRAARTRLQVVRRMAHRWSAGGGTPYAIWRSDALDMVRQVEGLEQLQWIGPDYFLHWSEGRRRGSWMQGADLGAEAEHSRRLAASSERGLNYVTEPREIAPGESAFMVYVPVSREGRFDGFIAAAFDIRGFFGDAIGASANDPFTFAVQYGGRTWFEGGDTPAANPVWQREGRFEVNDRQWGLIVRPTQRFIDEQQTRLPLIVLSTGLLIAFLSAFLVRYVLVARLKALRLQSSALALSASEERYELVMRGMSVGLWDWNIATNAMFLSQRCKDILRATAPDFEPTYHGFLGRLHPDDKLRVEMALQGHLKRRQPFDVELRIRRDDGEYIWVHTCGQAQYDEQGFATRMAGSMQNITPERQQAQELTRSEAQLRMLIENAPVAVAMFDRDMRYLMTSRRWIQDYELDAREVIGRSHYDVFPEIRDMPRWVDIHQRALRGERFDVQEDCWARTDGQKMWTQWAIHPWRDADGQVGGIVLFTEIITARKQAEAALRTSEAMNRAAMDKAPIGKAVVLPDGRFAKVNPALCRMLGYTEEEMLTRDLQGLAHAEDLPGVLAQVGELLEGRIISFDLEKRFLHRDGRVIWSQVSASAVRRADGSPEFLVAQIQDITERKNFDRMKDEFAAVVSNELREPLAAIRDSLGEIAAVRDLALPVSAQHVFEACRAHCERMSALVEGIVELERVASGQLRFEFNDESIADITRQAVSVNEAYSRVVLHAIDPALVVYVDRAGYVRVLGNLLSNAAKFSPPDRPIEVGAELRGEWVRVFVRDQGEGIPEEFRARIFGRFAQANPETGPSGPRQHGAGLGLFLSRQMVEQMRGTIGFESQPGAGTTFWVEFPRVSRGAHRLTA